MIILGKSSLFWYNEGVKNRRKKVVKSLTWQLTVGLLAIGFSVFLSVASILYLASQPYREAKREVLAKVQDSYQLKEIEDVYLTNRKGRTITTVLAKDRKGEEVAFLMDRKSRDLTYVQLSQGRTEKEARREAEKQGLKNPDFVKLTLDAGEPVWELASKGHYQVIAFKKEKE